MTTAFAAKPPSYAKIMELDRRVRDFPIPESLRVRCGTAENPPPTTALVMQRVLGTLLKETSMSSRIWCREVVLIDTHDVQLC